MREPHRLLAGRAKWVHRLPGSWAGSSPCRGARPPGTPVFHDPGTADRDSSTELSSIRLDLYLLYIFE